MKHGKGWKQAAAWMMALVLGIVALAPAGGDAVVRAAEASAGSDQVYGTKDDSGVITVEGVDAATAASTSASVCAYPIVVATYDAAGNFAGYESLYPSIINLSDCLVVTASATVDGVNYAVSISCSNYDSYSDAETAAYTALTTSNQGVSFTDVAYAYSYEFTQDELQKVLQVITATDGSSVFTYDDTDTKYGTYLYQMQDNRYYKLEQGGSTYDADSETTTYSYSGSVAIGAYLIKLEGTVGTTYNVAVASAYYDVDTTTGTKIANGTLSLTTGETVRSSTAWLKNSSPELTKVITNPNENDTTDNNTSLSASDSTAKGSSYEIGDMITYQLTIGSLLDFWNGGTSPIYFNVTDTLENMTLNMTENLFTVSEEAESPDACFVVYYYNGDVDENNNPKRTYLTQVTSDNVDTLSNSVAGEKEEDAWTQNYDIPSLDGCYTLAYDESTHTYVLNFVIQLDSDNKIVLPGASDYETYVKGKTNYSNSYYYTLNKISDISGVTLYVEYGATLDEGANVNADANVNSAILAYSNEPDTNPDPLNTAYAYTYAYTFDLDGAGLLYTNGTSAEDSLTYEAVTKVGENLFGSSGSSDATSPLSGAEFVLTRQVTGADNSTTTQYALFQKTDSGVYVFYKWLDSATVTDASSYDYEADTDAGDDADATYTIRVASDSAGQFYIKGLEASTYYFKEVKAPTGYSLNTNTYQITIATQIGNDGTLTSWTITVSMVGDTGENSQTTITYRQTTDEGTGEIKWTASGDGYVIKNTRVIRLPSTGGMGTMILVFFGCVLMVLAAFAYIRVTRRPKRVR